MLGHSPIVLAKPLPGTFGEFGAALLDIVSRRNDYRDAGGHMHFEAILDGGGRSCGSAWQRPPRAETHRAWWSRVAADSVSLCHRALHIANSLQLVAQRVEECSTAFQFSDHGIEAELSGNELAEQFGAQARPRVIRRGRMTDARKGWISDYR